LARVGALVLEFTHLLDDCLLSLVLVSLLFKLHEVLLLLAFLVEAVADDDGLLHVHLALPQLLLKPSARVRDHTRLVFLVLLAPEYAVVLLQVEGREALELLSQIILSLAPLVLVGREADRLVVV